MALVSRFAWDSKSSRIFPPGSKSTRANPPEIGVRAGMSGKTFPAGQLASGILKWYRGVTVKQYRPNVERQKELYSRMKAREIFRRMSGRTRAPDARRIADNSEPWLPGGVHSVADALYISDRIQEDIARWRHSNLPTA